MNLLRPEEVSEKLGITKAALPALRRREISFPQPIKVSQKVLRWDEADINSWLHGKKEKTNDENIGVG
jgi:predicted DNA-binding transcriptional regulator AlpA|tara:strand:+ start:4011 stop:4214 length:204 start_codon:yes stop_codon:yes gene_type:complete